MKRTRPTPADVLNALGALRRNNLRKLIGPEGKYPTQAEMAQALGVTEGYLTQLIGHRPIRKVTEPTARKFEYKLGLRTGSLDRAAG